MAAVAQMSCGCSSDTEVIVSIPGGSQLTCSPCQNEWNKLVESLLPDWLCWLRQNCSSERWKMILNALLLTHDHYHCPCFFSPDSLCMLLLFSAGPPKDVFWFSGSLHLILIDHRIIFYLNQLNSPENAKKLWRFLFLQGTLMSKLLTPSTY